MITDETTTLDLYPWTLSGFSIDWIQLKEEVGGNLPCGKVSLKFNRTEAEYDKIINENTGKITLTDNREAGYSFKIPIFITSRDYIKNSVILDFVCVDDPKFFSDRVSATYESITDAITTVYSWDSNITIESDQDNENKLHQNCETGYVFLNRLCNSFKSGTIFGYSWDGLFLKDLVGISSSGRDESITEALPKIIGGGTGNLTNTRPYETTYNRQQNYPIINPWTDEDNLLQETYTDYLPKNVISILGDRYYICRTGYEDMLKNHLDNTVRLITNFGGNYSITGVKMPNNYRLGDVICYYRADDVDIKESIYYTKCLVYSNEIFFGNGLERVGPHGFNFEWTTELRSIEDGPWTRIKETE